jgi:superfamily I DNA/RNA helicase
MAVTKKTAAVKTTDTKDSFRSAFKKVTSAPKVAHKAALNADGKAPHVMVSAFAGTGKTTTLIEALNVMIFGKSKLTPSDQQKAIWDAIGMEKPASIIFAAFNKSIATELERRVPSTVQASTMHALGNGLLRTAFGWLGNPNGWKTVNSLERLTGVPYKEMFDKKIPYALVRQLVSLCKTSLVDFKSPNAFDAIDALVVHHAIDLGKFAQEVVYGHVVACLKDAVTLSNKNKPREIDFDDMVWLPIVLDLPIAKVDLLLLDERQDTNAMQQELAFRMAHRLVCVGDNKQAIYGFAGADHKAYESLITRLGATDRGVIELPLTVTRRCGQKIVEEAQQFVPTFEAHETNSDGEVTSIKEEDFEKNVGDKDMVLCRCNAPLVSGCFRLLKEGRKARIQGRDIGKNLINQIEKFKTTDLTDLKIKLAAWYSKEEEKLQSKKFPSESALIALQDKYECIVVFADNVETVDGLIAKINTVFSDSGVGVLFSSVHKAKGLEADTVFILKPELMPHKMAKTAWQLEQEYNIKYIAITRAINKLVYVISAPK